MAKEKGVKKIAINEKKLSVITEKHGLTNRQSAVVREFLVNPNRTNKDIMISAGYTPATAECGSRNALRNVAVKDAIAEYIRNCKTEAKMLSVYENIFAQNNTDPANMAQELQLQKLKLDAVKELHKLRGDYAPTKSDSRSIKLMADVGVFDAIANTEPDVIDVQPISEEKA